jgi:two-component system cell cycle sensor histidine kinase/response regulator CckA
MTSELRILILEDSAADAELMIRELRRAGTHFTSKLVSTESDFLAQLRDYAPDFILADYSLPSYGGLSALAAVTKESPDVPFIFVSGSLGEEIAIDALKHGATDYVVKERISRLGPVVHRMLSEVEERRRAEERLCAQAMALEESELRYRELVENANEIIFTMDLEGNFTSLNKAAEAIVAYTRSEILQMNFRQLIVPDYLGEAEKIFRKSIAGEVSPPFELEITTKDGRRVTLEVSGRAVFQEEKPVGLQGIARDISERKLLQRRLNQSQKMEAVGQLAGGIAHDFNNLLTVIIGYSDMVLKGFALDDPRRADLGEIKRAGQCAADLTSKLLAFSRKQLLNPRVLDVNSLVENNSTLLRRLIGEDVELITALEPELGNIKVDPGQIETVIMNLAANARDAMPRGGRFVLETANVYLDEDFVCCHAGARTGRFVLLSASDTGMGMDAETRAHIFEPFFTTKAEGKGTGLGLATVYGIVKQSGGYIDVESESGKGTKFKIYLPRTDEAAEPLEVRKPVGPDGSETILVVEDASELRVLMGRSLEAKGYTVLAAKDAAEASKVSQEYDGTVHLLVTDMVMPGINGRTLAKELVDCRPGLKVLFVSGYPNGAFQFAESGPEVSFLQKPFDGESLALKVRECLQSND